jgi:hypothetical protein
MAIGAVVLNADVLREAMVAALAHPAVVEALAAALQARFPSTVGALPKFMSVKEFATHVRVSPRTLSYAQQRMTEGVHFSRTGRRIRFHVAEADAFLSAAKGAAAEAAADAASLAERARVEIARRSAKPAPAQEKPHAPR